MNNSDRQISKKSVGGATDLSIGVATDLLV